MKLQKTDFQILEVAQYDLAISGKRKQTKECRFKFHLLRWQ